jgi:Flp pilus assembly protein TadD
MGDVIELRAGRPALDEETRERMRRFLKDELTWAEVEGVTLQQAREIARIACELAARGRIADARIVFEGLVAINPRDSATQAALGTVYQRLSRLADARACYDRALELNQGNVVALANRGELRLREGDPAGLEDLAWAVKLDAEGATAAARRARGLLSVLARKAREVENEDPKGARQAH